MPIQSLLLLVNPVSGTSDNLKNAETIKNTLHGSWQVRQENSQHKGFFTEFLRDFDFTKTDVIGVVGGDGTMHEVLNGLLLNPNYSDTPVLLFPCGTGNAFNHDLACLDIETACQNLHRGNTQKIDILELQTSNRHFYAFNIVGWGLVSVINLIAEKMRWLGDLRYTLSGLVGIFKNPRFSGNVRVDDQTFSGDFCFVFISNTIHTGKAMKMSPKAKIDDGLLDVIVVKHLSFWKLLKLFPLIFSGKHIESDLLTYLHAKEIHIEAAPQKLNIDGEMSDPCPISVRVSARKLNVIV